MSQTVQASEFDVCGPLPPPGITLLEASAGTGKTFAIAALAARLVASGVPMSELLLVTFTRMATGELRERVRARLVEAEQALSRLLNGGVPPEGDAVLELLAQGTAEELRERQVRLSAALADFDSATIATTHGFCQHVLAGLGVVGDVSRDTAFVEDVSDLVDEVVDDLYVRRFHRYPGEPPITRPEALAIGRAAVESPLAVLEPQERSPADAGEVWAMRRRLAEAVRREVDVRKRRLGVMTYDDLLTRLRDALADPTNGAAAAARLRRRYRYVLVDEFQDTDPIQWEILRRAFAEGGTTLVLIGDPKQAIYAFRGADVYAYLEAARSAATTATLAVNWRSDQPLIDAFDGLFGNAQLGHPGIVYLPVRAAHRERRSRLDGAPLHVRVLRRDSGLVALTRSGYVSKPSARELIARDLAADVVRLLTAREPVEPRDVAVLVTANAHARTVRDALDAVGVPAVINGAGSVFGTSGASEWLRLLEALERPASDGRARSAALTSLLGWTAERLAAATEDELGALHARLHAWASVVRQRGVAALYDRIAATQSLPARVLAQVDGERHLTDLRHIAELLHAAAIEHQLGAASLTAWLRQRIRDADRDAAHDERSRRLDSDAEAVQVLTTYRAKGLEFPVVYVPFAWTPGWIPDDAAPTFHDADNADRWTLDVGGDSPTAGRSKLLHRDERRGEDLRLLYVALTRARHRAVVWWAGAADSGNSPLGRLLFERRADGFMPPAGGHTPPDADVVARLEELAGSTAGCIAVEAVDDPSGAPWASPPRELVMLDAARFERSIDVRWGRSSYTRMIAGAYEQQVASEPEQDVLADEAAEPAPPEPGAAAGADGARLRAMPLPLAAMPGGADVGDIVHRVLQATDFGAADLDAELALRLREQQARRGVDLGDEAVVVAGLRAALETPLAPLLGELRLRDVVRADRLDEVVFELPLAGGETPSGAVSAARIGALLDESVPAGDAFAGYGERLRELPQAGDLRGYLTGTLDVVLRAHAADGAPRYAVVDYKTNWLSPEDEEPSAWHYRPEALGVAMQRGHYPLQALLYLVALHRYLRWRVPGYEPDRDIAGVLYLFVRGMAGLETPRVGGAPCGVFSWTPPRGLVVALSDVLDGG